VRFPSFAACSFNFLTVPIGYDKKTIAKGCKIALSGENGNLTNQQGEPMGAFDRLKALKADPSSTAAVAEDVAAAMLRGSPGDMVLAQRRFIEAVVTEPVLVAQVFTDDEIRAKAQQWFAKFARSAKAEGAAMQFAPQGHHVLAAPNPIAAEGHTANAPRGQPSLANRSELIGGGGQNPHARSAYGVLPPSSEPKSSGGGLTPNADKAKLGLPPPARPQSPERVAARIAAVSATRTLYDSFTVQGRPIGDVPFSRIESIRAASAQEAAVLRQIQRHCQPESPDQLVRDAVKLSDLERFVQRGAEVADAA
jgi:hypothetical protein